MRGHNSRRGPTLSHGKIILVRLRDKVCSEGAFTEGSHGIRPQLRDRVSVTASLSGGIKLSPRSRDRVFSEGASFSAASACAPLPPVEFPLRTRDKVFSEGASFSAASALPHSHGILPKIEGQGIQ